jgi:hypothetical protein
MFGTPKVSEVVLIAPLPFNVTPVIALNDVLLTDPQN